MEVATHKGWRGNLVYDPEIGNMVGRVFTRVENLDDEEIVFTGPEGTFTFYHRQDCCESVCVESVVGDLEDLVGEPLLIAEESSQDCPDSSESGTWTFYKFATRKGYVDIRWVGYSNGHYSESVSLYFPNKMDQDIEYFQKRLLEGLNLPREMIENLELKKVAEDICSVQPMDLKLMGDLDKALSKQEGPTFKVTPV